MKKLFFVLALFLLSSCCITKHGQKDPVKTAIKETIKELKYRGAIN